MKPTRVPENNVRVTKWVKMYMNFSYASISGYSLSLSGKISDSKTRVLLLPHSFIFSSNSCKIDDNIPIHEYKNIYYLF